MPLAFTALLVRFLKDLPTKVAAPVAGVLAVVGSGAPSSAGVIVAAIGGTGAGFLLSTRRSSRTVEIDFGSGCAWILVLALGIGSFVLRLSFIHLHGWLGEFPPRVERALAYLPAAVLAALVFPALFVLDGSPVDVLVDDRVIAGSPAAIVAWRTRSALATIGGTGWGFSGLFTCSSVDRGRRSRHSYGHLPESVRAVRVLRFESE